MKLHYFFMTILVFVFFSCSFSPEEILSEQITSPQDKQKIDNFEKDYVKRTQIIARNGSEDEVQLIGYKYVVYRGSMRDSVNELWNKYQTEIEENGSFLTIDGIVRVYCPLKNAIVTINGIEYHADSCGVLAGIKISQDDEIFVCGRDATNNSIYTTFGTKLSPSKIINNSLIFDLGEKSLSHSNHRHKLLSRSEGYDEDGDDEDGGVSCTQNHGSYANCTFAFNCYQDRCPKVTNMCLDYNGWGTNCTHNHWYFTGSDCSVAMASGHCWNELMK